MRKIIPLIILMALSVFFTKAQNVSQAERTVALQLASQLVSNNDAAGISADLISNSKVFYTYEDAASGIRYVSLQQTYKGIPVYNQILALSFRNGKLLSNFGAFDPNIEKTINVASGSPSVTAESAVQSALSDRGFHASQMAIAINRKDDGRFVEFGKMGIASENITTQLTWVPNELTKTYNLAWQVYIVPKTTSDYWMVRVNAVDNSILGVDNYTDYDNWGTPDNNATVRYPGFEYGKLVSNNTNSALRNFFDFKQIEDPTLVTTASYRVVPLPAESPLHPGGAPALRTDPWTNAGVVANAVTLKWHTGAAATDYDYTRGNNVYAYQDRSNDNTGTPAEAATSTTAFPNLTYDFVPDFTQEPIVTSPPNQQFNITNLFYWNNLIHDIFYGYGFTEAGKNFQDDNLGRGGAGGDWVRAEAQDGGGSNNANFSTPADGSLPRMQMYLWTAPTPDRDGDADNGIIIHEYGHGISNRSNQGGTGCLGNAEQAGEGWSDYLGLMLTQNWATSTVSSGFNSPRGIGTYALNQPNTGPGIRPQRYCTDFTVNNATYSTLPGQAIPHGVGWVFCSALWELTWELINDPSTTGITPNIYNFAGTGGNVVALRLVMEGLRTQQCQPGFISARNAILKADTTLYAASHACAIWRAFARRGMGFGALEGSTGSINDQTVSFTNNPACGVVTGPTVTINQAAAQPDPTSTSPINFTVVFSEAVVGFANGDVTLGGTAGATTQNITGGPTTWNVAVSGMTTTGTVTASIAAGVCTNAALETNNASTSTDNSVTFTTTPPGVCTTFVGTVGPANTATSLRAFRDGALSTCAVPGPCSAGISGALHYVQHTWTNPVNAVQCVTVTYTNTASNFSFVTAHNGSVVLTNLCTNYLGDPGSSAAAGTPIVWSFNAPPLATIVFHVGNVTAGQTAGYQLDINAPICAAAAPSVTINQAAAQPDPTGTSPINFTAVFSEAVTGFANGDVTLSGTAGATTQNITGGPTTYNIAVSGMTGSGTVIATIPAGVCTNATSVANTASTSTDNTVTYNAPVGCTNVDPVPNQTVCNGASTAAVNFTSSTPGTTFSWVNNTTSIGLGASGTGNIPSFVATNATAAPVVATITVTPTINIVTPTTTTFNFTGGAQTFTVPAGVSSINITTLGAEGGTGAIGGNGSAGGAGGRGSRATGTLAVTPGQVLTIFVGGAGGAPTAGFNGGGTGGNANSGGGGGASDVRFPGASSADRIIVAGGGAGGGRGGCETGSTITGGAGGNGDGNGVDGTNSPNGGGGFGAIGTTPGGAGIGCGGFLGAPGLAGSGPAGGNGGAGQACCCFSFGSVPGGGGGGGGFIGGAGGGGGSAGTVGCLGNDKGGGGGGAGGTSYTGGVTAGAVTTNIQTGNGQVVFNYNVTTVCNGPSVGFTITVNPTPSVNAIPNQVVCQNAPTAPVNFTGTPVGAVFQWTNNTPAIGLAAAGTGNIPSFIAQNPGTTPLVATITVTPVTGLATPIVTTFNFTGAVQTYTVPAGVTSINLKSWGAQGNNNAGGIVGGLGGYAEGNLAVTAGQVLNVYVGGGATTSINGGYNGGGAAGVNAGCAAAQGGGGGGASDVRIAPYALANRVIVGAGGGGAGGNRTAGCGRGSGGGGGGGLYGGGGGAGWPGVPGSEGPVPTGGTQVAGGAAGVTTWTGGGPTNGFPGVLAVGGAGGIEVASGQGTPTGPGERGGIGGGLTGGSGLYNNANNWNGQSGAGGSSYIGGVTGGLTTAGLRTGAGQVQITYTPVSAATCFGAARTFTITVNPNANLIIVADPGTTLCEGDPTLLTVYDAGAATAPGTLYTQGTGTPANGSPSQVFEPANAAFSSQGADDFTIPAGGLWTITQVTANGIGAGTPTSVNVFFYSNAGTNLPGAAIASFTNITTFVKVGANYTVTLPSSVSLGAGTYWMSFQVNMSFATGGQWFWGNFGTTNVGNQYAWQNPGGGFATPCTTWGYGATGCLVGGTNRNNMFSIIGTNVGLGPQSTGTFLWSPAAGLSSTTSNPVAASPMNTTTYTVVRTTGAGCQASAQVTITVNKRPVVTTQPANQVRCVGNTATFTIGATGTGLIYQWQVSTAGCAGPWTNLTNIAPYSNVTTPTLTVNPVTQLMSGYAYRCVVTGTCAPWTPPTNVSNCATLTVNANPNISINPVGPVCGGVAGINGTALTVVAGAPPIPGNVTVNSGTINVPIPDGTNVAATSNLTIAGVPVNATITEIKVNMNINHTWVGDVNVNLRAPNNTILNLVSRLDGGTGGNATDNFTNTAFSSLGGSTISGFAAPRTGTFAAEARAGTGPIGFVQTVTSWGAGGLVPAATNANGLWTLAMGDAVGTDVGALTNWSISIDYTTPGSGTQVLSYVWSPLAGLYTLPNATGAYTGTNLTTVYAAPTAQTTYTVRATDVATGCFTDASVLVNYTPPAPTITPSSVTMCLGDPAVKLKASSSTTSTVAFNSGTIAVAIPDNNQAGASHTIAVSGIPANATVTGMRVKMTIPHTFIGDLVIALRAPNNNVLNLDFFLSNTFGGVTTGFSNTIFTSAAGAPAVSTGTNPYSASFRPDGQIAATGNGPAAPTGYTANMANYAALISSLTPANVNGNYTLAMYDGGAIDIGTLTNWEIEFTYVQGVVASPAVWSPAAGLFSNAGGTIPYVAGTPVDSVWAAPTTIGANPYTATVNNMLSFSAVPATPMAGGNGNNLVSFNVKNNNTFPVTLAGISSNAFGSGAVAVRAFYKTTGNAGNPGPITAANGFTQFGSSNVNVTANTLNPVLTGLTLTVPAGATYAIALDFTGATFPAYTNGAATTVTYSANGCDIITGGNVGWGGPAAPATPVNNPRNFNGTVTFLVSGPGTCQSPARTVIVTVNQPTVLNANIPANQTICTDKVATFTAAVVTGTGPHTYQWQVSTNGGGTWTNIANGGVYSGATTATLTITAPPVSMNGYQYRAIVAGAAPCAAQTSRIATLTVNPLPVIVISAAPYTSLLPGLQTTLSSTVTPNPATTYSWIRNGTVLTNPSLGVVSGIGTGSLKLDVDGQGDYQLRVTDVNGCTNISNTITIKDSASGKCFIYPNPTSGVFQVRYYSVAGNVLPRTLTIYDAKGDRVYTKYYAIGRPYDRMDVDMRAYGKGLYWVEIGDLNGNRLTVCRVVIQ